MMIPLRTVTKIVNTDHHTNLTKDRKKFRGFGSGALRRTDQESRAHFKMGGKHPTPVGDEGGGGPRAVSRFGDYGTVGAKLTRPER